ncbi:MAG TPA: succinate dehydrogenase assembly factor 2 [Nevskiaceae bacterium]|nr:succinate dehydrogenase assembly factor 2 [Nevskiaceae bacterium]
MNEGRLKWLLRRGMKELDVMVSRYHAQRYGQASADEQALFLQLLQEVEDPDLWAWVMGYQPVPAPYQTLVERLREGG